MPPRSRRGVGAPAAASGEYVRAQSVCSKSRHSRRRRPRPDAASTIARCVRKRAERSRRRGQSWGRIDPRRRVIHGGQGVVPDDRDRRRCSRGRRDGIRGPPDRSMTRSDGIPARKMTCSLAPDDASWAWSSRKERRPVMDRDVGDDNDPMARQQPALVAMGWTRPKDDVEALDQLGWRRGWTSTRSPLRAARRSPRPF